MLCEAEHRAEAANNLAAHHPLPHTPPAASAEHPGPLPAGDHPPPPATHDAPVAEAGPHESPVAGAGPHAPPPPRTEPVTWDIRDRRGRTLDPEWANRRRLLRARERLADKSFATRWNAIVAEDNTGQILSAWIATEELRTLLSTVRVGGDAHLTRHRLHRFLCWCIDSQIPELLTLAATVDTWWPEINAFITTGITNAATEGYNRLVKQVKRAARGFRNTENSARRIRFNCTRKQRTATQTSC